MSRVTVCCACHMGDHENCGSAVDALPCACGCPPAIRSQKSEEPADLGPCPFCGGSSEVLVTAGATYQAACAKCSFFIESDKLGIAVGAWNDLNEGNKFP